MLTPLRAAMKCWGFRFLIFGVCASGFKEKNSDYFPFSLFSFFSFWLTDSDLKNKFECYSPVLVHADLGQRITTARTPKDMFKKAFFWFKLFQCKGLVKSEHVDKLQRSRI